MSGPATHYIVGQLLIDSYYQNEPNYAAQLTANSSSLNLGTMGPDFLFFNVHDWPGGDYTASPLHTFIQVTETIEKFKKTIKEELEPVIDSIEDASRHSASLSEMGDLYDDLRNVLAVLSGTLISCAESNITDSNLVFDLLSHPMQINESETKWWWFDTMHYRKSGEFAKQMYMKTRSNPDSPEHAFAMGYMSHVASDVVGHPYVNTIVGGPYRLHPKRHKLVENYQDVWNFRHFNNDDFCYSNLFKEFELSDRELDKISKLIAKITKDVYKQNVDVPYGNELTEDNIKDAYHLWMRWFKGTTGQEELPPPRDYELSNEVQEAWDIFVRNLGDISDLVGDVNVTGNSVLDSLLAALLAATLGPILLALAAADFLAGLTITLGAAPVRYFMSYIYNSIYDSFHKYRFALTLNGFAFPLQNNLDNDKVQHTYNPGVSDFYGYFADRYNFPKQSYSAHGAESHLVHPQSPVEKFKTTPSPKTYMSHTPDYYVNGSITFNTNILAELATTSANGASLNQLHIKMDSECLGNAVQLSKELAYFSYKFDGSKEVPNLSLDADRGMGYRCWKVNGPIDSTDEVKPIFTDR